MSEPKIERRFLLMKPGEVRIEGGTEDQPPELAGYAAVYHQEGVPGTEFMLWENVFERFVPGCFDESIKNDDVRCLFNHDANFVLGRNTAGTLQLSVDQVGLAFRCQLPATTVGGDVHTLIDRGDVSGCSIGFWVQERNWIEREGEPTIREIVKVQLLDVGPVTYPAYQATAVSTRSRDALQADLDHELRRSVDRRSKVRALRMAMLAHHTADR